MQVGIHPGDELAIAVPDLGRHHLVAAKQPLENMILSNSIRAAVIGMAKTLSQEVATDNLTVNSICPGWILTDRLVSLVKKKAESHNKSYESTLAELASSIPIKRCGTPEEVRVGSNLEAAHKGGF